MGYDLTAKNPDVDEFHFGAFSWPVLLEACGCLWPSLHSGGQWYCVFEAEPRFEGCSYPPPLANDGFEVTAEEARIMARMARNFVAIQRTLPDDHISGGLTGKPEFRREDVEAILKKAMTGRSLDEKWPVKVRADFTDRFEKFADWAERSGGFEIH